MRVLVTGAGGLLGGRLAVLLAQRFSVVAGWRESPPPPALEKTQLDLLAADSPARALDDARPQAVVHSAALADVDCCEAEPERAARINVDGSTALARLCHARGVRLIALSTDLVLPGTRPFSKESDPVESRLVYGQTKRRAEVAVLAQASDSAVVRVALVQGRGYGPRATASESLAWALRAGRSLRLYTDQHRTPVDAESVADAVARLLTGRQSGLFHLGGPERLSRYELGLRVAQVLGLPAHLIEGVREADHAVAALRPPDVSLDSGRALAELDWRPRSLDEGIREGRLGPD